MQAERDRDRETDRGSKWRVRKRAEPLTATSWWRGVGEIWKHDGREAAGDEGGGAGGGCGGGTGKRRGEKRERQTQESAGNLPVCI